MTYAATHVVRTPSFYREFRLQKLLILGIIVMTKPSDRQYTYGYNTTVLTFPLTDSLNVISGMGKHVSCGNTYPFKLAIAGLCPDSRPKDSRGQQSG
jgi:hypothetical protein